MPDTFDEIIFSGKFNPAEIVKGVDQMTDSLKKLQGQSTDNTVALNDTSKALADKTAQIEKLKANIAGLDKSQSDYSANLKRLNDGLSTSQKQFTDLTNKFNQQKTQLDATSAALTDITAKYNAANAALQNLQNISGKPIDVALNDNKITTQLTDLKDGLTETFGDIDFAGFDGLQERLIGAKDQVEQIKILADELEKKIGTVAPDSQEYKDLNEALEASKFFIESYNGAVVETGVVTDKTKTKQVSYRTEIQNVRNELKALEEANETGGEKYEQLLEKAAHLTEEYKKQTEEIKILSHETKFLDFGLAALKAAAGGYETVIGVQALFGESNEEAEETQKKLLAVMALLQGAEELYEAISKQSIIVTVARNVVTKALAATELFLAETLGIGAAAAAGFSKALVFTGLGALIIGLGFLVSKIIDYQEAAKEAAAEQKRFNDVQKKGLENAAEETAKLRTLYNISQDQTQSMKDRNKAIDELQRVYPTYFGNLSNEEILAGKAADAYDRLTKSIIKRGLADSIKDEIKQIQKDILPALQNLANADNMKARIEKDGAVLTGKRFKTLANGNVVPESISISQDPEEKKRQEEAIDRRFEKDKEIVDKANEKIKRYIDLVGADALIDAFIDPEKERNPKKTREVLNIFEQELQKLKTEFDKLADKVFTNEATIQKQADNIYDAQLLAYAKARKKGQLTKAQQDILIDRADTLRNLTADKNIADFKIRQSAFLKAIDEDIINARDEENMKRISRLTSDYERERQTIETETTKTINAAGKNRDRLIADIRKAAPANGLTEADLKPQIDAINQTYSDLLEDLNIIRQQKLQKLAFDTFEKLSDEAKRVLDAGNLGVSDGSVVRIKEQTDLYNAGKISYQRYQKELTKIARFEMNERFQLQKLFLEAEIKRRELQLLNDKTLTDSQVKQLRDEITKLRQQLDDAINGNVTANAANDNSDRNERISKLQAYTQAVGNLANAVISFWQQANEAEAAALDRSISIQQKRVDAAKTVAERGNAEYLQLEEERLQQLEIKRENAARRQLAVNAALQASQVITALISGIAQGASVGGPLGALIGLTAIVGAIVSGYAIAKSLQPQEPSFFVGTEDTGPGGNADNKQGFRAIIHPHERIVNREDNKQLKGMSNKELLRVVNASRIMIQENYGTRRTPELNLSAMDMANSSSSMQNVRLAGLLEDNNDKLENMNILQRQTIRVLGSLGIDVKIDKNGVAVSVLETIEEIEKSKNS